MQSQRVLPSQEQVESAICSAATALGAGRKVAGELAHKLAPRLHALFGSDQGDWLLEAVDTSESAAPAGVAGSEESVVRGQEEGTWPRFEGLESVVGPNDMVYVDRFEDGEWLRNVRMTLNEAQTLAKMRAYDIVVDEAVHTFQIGGSAARPTTRLRPPQRGMLWLLLMNAKGGFSYDAVRQLFRIGKLEGNESIQRCVYQLRLLLGKERGKCVIDRGASEHYFVSPEGWSFLWIRRRKDNMRSELYVGPSNARSS